MTGTTHGHVTVLRHERNRRVGYGPTGHRLSHAGLQRRIQALAAIGWPLSLLDQRSGLPDGTLHELATTTDQSRLDQYSETVCALYGALAYQPPNGMVCSAEIAATRESAQRCGWISALGWDEGAIDNAAARPASRPERTRPLIHLEDVQWLATQSVKGAAAISQDLGVTRGALRKALHGRNRQDLWRTLVARDHRQGAAA